MAHNQQSPPPASPGAAIRRVQNLLRQSQLALPAAYAQLQPQADPQLQTAAGRYSLNDGLRIVFGKITDVAATAHLYRVQLADLVAPVPATPLSPAGSLPVGAKELRTYPAGTDVLCVWGLQLPHAFILGPVPAPAVSAESQLQSVLATASRQRVDDAHKRPLQMADHDQLAAMTGGRPMDATTAGEWGAITETGMRVFLDSFMAQLGLDEMSSLTVLFHDALVRLSGYNLQTWSSAHERESFDDEGETSDWTGFVGYPWEQLGLYAPGDPARELSPEEWQQTTPHYSRLEPADDRATPWHREREWHGYLGQGGKRNVQGPPTGGDAEILGDDHPHPGFFDSWTGFDGQHVIQSATGIHLLKRPVVLAPRRVRRPEQSPDGDSPENYKASSQSGNGPEHAITTGPAATGGQPLFQRLTGVMDTHAYLCNYATVHPFVVHEHDYSVPEEQAATWVDGASAVVPQFAALNGQQYIDTGAFFRGVRVDHRYDLALLSKLASHISLLDDGSIVIGSGCGAQIRLGGGNLTLSAPGDVNMLPGRDLVGWGGHDVILRAKNSADVSATLGDIRLKAQRNLEMLGGNEINGGVLIESRAPADYYDFAAKGEAVRHSGIILRAPKSQVVAWGKDVYLRTGGGEGDGAVTAGSVVIDGARGKAPVIIRGSEQITYVQRDGAVTHHFLSGEGETERSNTWNRDTHICCANDTLLNGTLTVAGDVSMTGTIYVAEGHILTEQARNNPYVSPLGDAAAQITEYVSRAKQLAEQSLPNDGNNLFERYLQRRFYESNKAGNDKVMGEGQFGFRIVADYGTGSFRMPELHWQQLARLSQQFLGVWVEQSVVFHGSEEYPYPGKPSYETPVLDRYPLQIYDPATGRARDRRSAGGAVEGIYASPAFGDSSPGTLQEYTVIR